MILDNFIKKIVDKDYEESEPLKNINKLYNNLMRKNIEEESKEKTTEELIEEVINNSIYINKLEAWIFARIMEEEGD